MNRRYILGIIITVLVLSLNQYFIQYWLGQKKSDANIINVAGKQRMLSQRITAEFYTINEEQKSNNSLKEMVNEWVTAHEYIKSKLKDKAVSEELTKDLLKLETEIDYIKNHLEHSNSQKINLTNISQNQNKFLVEMDAIVKTLEKDADKKLDFIIWIEYFLLFVALLILILEVYFIYRPIGKTLKASSLILEEKNEQLNYAISKVKAKNKELNEVTYIASHDLQEPLRTVSSMVDLLNDKYQSQFDEQGKTMLGFLGSASGRMSNLVKDLLEYSILGQDKTLTKVNCNHVLEDVTEDLQASIINNNAKVNWDHLPTVNAYKSELRLLFQNLISNAIKFQKPEVNPQIQIDSEEQEGHWKFKISDNGIGIKEAYIGKIFSIFKRVHTEEIYDGTGIGLAHCKKIVEMHDGDIWVESTEGEGSTFYFTISKEIVNLQ